VVLYVFDVAKSVEFYNEAFGLTHKFTHEGGDYAEMETGGTTLAFAAYSLIKEIMPYDFMSAEMSLIGAQITLEPENVRTAFKHALKHGAKELVAPEVKPWNFEVAMVRDCNGHIVELAKAL
jgi:uncharacterized glyoxalase superfamily protein PhnB